MKFAPFEYLPAATWDDAVAALAADEDAKAMAGGQSLLPLMALRLARPSTIVDISRVAASSVAVEADAWLRIGALTRHAELLRDRLIGLHAPLLAAAASHVGHPAIRNRGTLGGSLAHADPAAELPAALVALGALVEIRGPSGNRQIAAASLGEGYFSTTLRPGELISDVLVRLPPPAHGAAFCEWAGRAGDFAEVGVGVSVELDHSGACARVKGAVCGIGGTPVEIGGRLTDVLAGFVEVDASALRAVAASTREAVDADDDADKGALAALLASRAAARAFDDARRRSMVVA